MHGETDEHLGLGKGNISLVEVLAALKEYAPNAIWAIEANLDDMEDSILWLKEKGLCMGESLARCSFFISKRALA